MLYRVLNPNNTNARPPRNSTIPSSSSTPGAPHYTTPTATAAPISTLTPASKAGIGVGVAVGAIIIVIVIWYIVKVRKQSSKDQKTGPITSELSQGDKHLATEL